MNRLRRIIFATALALFTSFIIAVLWRVLDHPNVEENSSILIQILVLTLFMIFDFLIGLLNAIVFKRSKKTENGGLSSKTGTRGLIKKTSILILVLLTHMLQELVLKEFPFLFTTVVVGFMTMEFVSIVENLALMGVPIPRKLLSVLEIMREKNPDKKEEREEKEEDTSARLDR